jgi:hypothetical protein
VDAPAAAVLKGTMVLGYRKIIVPQPFAGATFRHADYRRRSRRGYPDAQERASGSHSRAQLPSQEIQELADFVGDSLGLAYKAAETNAEVIAFCGVHFMAETAKIVNPTKTVVLPDLNAGAHSATRVLLRSLLHFSSSIGRRNTTSLPTSTVRQA